MMPDFARGWEKDGWVAMPDHSVMRMEPDAECYVYPGGTIEIFNQASGQSVKFKMKSPLVARKVADSLMEGL